MREQKQCSKKRQRHCWLKKNYKDNTLETAQWGSVQQKQPDLLRITLEKGETANLKKSDTQKSYCSLRQVQ